MKKVGRIILPVLILLVTSFSYVKAQQEDHKVKVWEIHYDIYTGDAGESGDAMGEFLKLGKSLFWGDKEPIIKAYINDDNMRIEQKGLISHTQISNLKDSVSYMLYADQKLAQRSPITSPNVNMDVVGDSIVNTAPTYDETIFKDESKMIAGMKCYRAVLVFDNQNDKDTLDVWYAKGKPKLFWGTYDYLEKIPGTALQISTKQFGTDIGIIATLIEEKELSDSLFKVPNDYRMEDYMTVEDSLSVTEKEDFELSKGLIWEEKDGLWGIKDLEGNTIREPKYDDTYAFEHGLAVVSVNGMFGMINKDAKEVVPIEYTHVFAASEKCTWLTKDEKYALYDVEHQKFLTGYVFDDVSAFSEGLSYVLKNKKYGYVNEQGKIVIPCKFDEAYAFQAGEAIVKSGKKIFFIDVNGKKTETAY